MTSFDFWNALYVGIGVGIGGEIARRAKRRHQQKVDEIGADLAGPAPNFLPYYLVFVAASFAYAVYIGLSHR